MVRLLFVPGEPRRYPPQLNSDAMPHFLRIRTSKFPILPDEETELVNEGTYGKAFAQYLQAQLLNEGYSSPFICCEDWGWWVELKLPSKSIGLCCYRHHDENTECDFVCSPSPQSDRVWSWRRFKTIDIGTEIAKLVDVLSHVFTADSDIEFMGLTQEFPF